MNFDPTKHTTREDMQLALIEQGYGTDDPTILDKHPSNRHYGEDDQLTPKANKEFGLKSDSRGMSTEAIRRSALIAVGSHLDNSGASYTLDTKTGIVESYTVGK